MVEAAEKVRYYIPKIRKPILTDSGSWRQIRKIPTRRDIHPIKGFGNVPYLRFPFEPPTGKSSVIEILAGGDPKSARMRMRRQMVDKLASVLVALGGPNPPLNAAIQAEQISKYFCKIS